MSAILRWGPRLFHYIGGRSLLVEDEVENLYVNLKTGGALSMFSRGELSSIFVGKIGQEVKELSLFLFRA